MKKCKITVMRMARYDDLMAQYENPISHACDMEEGQTFIANGWEMPEGFCPWAWVDIYTNLSALAAGGTYTPWNNTRGETIACCTDGIRPVSFELKAL